ncbi:MAG: hypothetical protein R3E73_14895 [Porticoccaceae bacterium]
MEVQWPSGRLLREYTVLLDLPVFTESSQVKSVEAASTRSQPRTQSGSERLLPVDRVLLIVLLCLLEVKNTG